MPVPKGWKPDPLHVKRAGKLGAAKSPWREPIPLERKKKLREERMARLREMGVIQ